VKIWKIWQHCYVLTLKHCLLHTVHTSMKNTNNQQITTHTVQLILCKRNLNTVQHNSSPNSHRLLCLFSENRTVSHCLKLPQFSKSCPKKYFVFCPVTSLRRKSRLYLQECDRGRKERTFDLRKSYIIPRWQQ